MSNITEKAILVSLNMSSFDPLKYNRALSSETARAHAVDSDKIRTRVRIVSKDDMRPVVATMTEPRDYHYSVTLPWSDNGWRLLPIALYDEYVERMNQYRAVYDRVTTQFENDYETTIYPNAQRELNGTMPAGVPDSIRGRFAYRVRMRPLPSDDVRVALSEAECAQLSAQITADRNADLRAAVGSVWGRLSETITALLETLQRVDSGKGKKIHASLVDNIGALCELIPALNISGDPELSRFADRVRGTLAGLDVSELRGANKDSNAYRTDAIEKAQQLAGDAEKFAGIYG